MLLGRKLMEGVRSSVDRAVTGRNDSFSKLIFIAGELFKAARIVRILKVGHCDFGERLRKGEDEMGYILVNNKKSLFKIV